MFSNEDDQGVARDLRRLFFVTIDKKKNFI